MWEALENFILVVTLSLVTIFVFILAILTIPVSFIFGGFRKQNTEYSEDIDETSGIKKEGGYDE